MATKRNQTGDKNKSNGQSPSSGEDRGVSRSATGLEWHIDLGGRWKWFPKNFRDCGELAWKWSKKKETSVRPMCDTYGCNGDLHVLVDGGGEGLMGWYCYRCGLMSGVRKYPAS